MRAVGWSSAARPPGWAAESGPMTDEPNESSKDKSSDGSPARAHGTGARTNGGSHAEARPGSRPAPTAAPRETSRRRTRAAPPTRRADRQDNPAAAELEHAEAEHLELRQSRIGTATARSVVVRQGAVGGARGDEVLVTQGAVGGARAQTVTIDKGALGGAIAGDFRLRMGFAQGVLARDVRIEQGGARTVIGNTVRLGPQSGALLVVARRVEGGRFLIDWREALAFGAAFAVVTAFLRRRNPGG